MSRPILRRSQRPARCQLCLLGLSSASFFSASARPPPAAAKAPLISTLAGPPNAAKLAQNGSLQHGGLLARRVSTAAAAAAATRPTRTTAKPSQQRPVVKQRELPDLAKLSAAVQQSKSRFLSTDGIPTDQLTTVALKTCLAAADAIAPHLVKSNIRPGAAAASLLSLDGNGSKLGVAGGSSGGGGSSSSSSSAKARGAGAPAAQLRIATEAISQAAYAIVSHPNVLITPGVLGLYVDIQARLGRPETLAHVLELYGTKPEPRIVGGVLQYVDQKANRADKAIEAETAEAAVNAAIDAKNLDAAIAIIEACYSTDAHRRQKLLRKGLLPAITLAFAPPAVYGVASAVSQLQTAVDPATATKVAFAGIIAYLGFTATIGLTARVTADDHMKRVTWAPGTPLHQRWLREEERAALDRVALAWGFREPWRHGEEGGAEWEALREYIGIRDMILDRVEFMEGMN